MILATIKKAKKHYAALILVFALSATLSACSNSELGFEKTENILETAPETEPEYGEPVIGGHSILSTDEEGDFSANLTILGISHLPDGTEDGNFYDGNTIQVQITDSKRGIVLLSSPADSPFLVLNGEVSVCAENTIELLKIDQDGEKYILKVDHTLGPGRKMTAFAVCDTSNYSDGMRYDLKWYKVINSNLNNAPKDYNCATSDNFTYLGGALFRDDTLAVNYEFDTKNLTVTISGIPPVFEEPAIGKNSILAESSLGDLKARIEIYNILSFPKDNEDALYEGENICLSLYSKDKPIVRQAPIPGHVGTGGTWMSPDEVYEKSTGEGALQIFETEQNGKKHYVLVQRCMYDKETDTSGVRFICFDIEKYEAYQENPDEILPFVIEYTIRGVQNGFGVDGEPPISDSFEYMGGTTFRDSVYGYEIELDCENLTGRVRIDG